MSKLVSLSAVLTLGTLGLTAPLLAQERSAVSPAELAAAVSAEPTATRDAVRQLLTTGPAERAAARMGIGAAELSTRVAGLDDATLDLIARRADVGGQELAGGSNVVISTTVVIIGLLLLILLVD